MSFLQFYLTFFFFTKTCYNFNIPLPRNPSSMRQIILILLTHRPLSLSALLLFCLDAFLPSLIMSLWLGSLALLVFGCLQGVVVTGHGSLVLLVQLETLVEVRFRVFWTWRRRGLGKKIELFSFTGYKGEAFKLLLL